MYNYDVKAILAQTKSTYLRSLKDKRATSKRSILSTLFPDTLSICSSLKVRDQFSNPFRTTGKIIVLYILMFMFLDSKREDKRFWTEW
jgi:hypothetical protein